MFRGMFILAYCELIHCWSGHLIRGLKTAEIASAMKWKSRKQIEFPKSFGGPIRRKVFDFFGCDVTY